MNPVCVDACMMRALDFGELDDLRAKYGSDLVREVPSIASAEGTSPNLLIKTFTSALRKDFTEIIL